MHFCGQNHRFLVFHLGHFFRWLRPGGDEVFEIAALKAEFLFLWYYETSLAGIYVVVNVPDFGFHGQFVIFRGLGYFGAVVLVWWVNDEHSWIFHLSSFWRLFDFYVWQLIRQREDLSTIFV